MILKREYIFWLVAVILTLLFIGLLHEIMLPFVLGIVLAYFLNPVADWLQNAGLSRTAATLFLALIFTFVAFIAILTLAPLLYQQFSSLIQALPEYYLRFKLLVESNVKTYFGTEFILPELGYEKTLKNIAGNFAQHSGKFFNLVWESGKLVFSIVSILVITPVVAIFLLHDWNNLVSGIKNLVPRDHVESVVKLGHEIDDVVAGFIRGQVSVCLILGTFYAFGLHMAGLNSGILIGLSAGLISFIPYVGTAIGFIFGIGVALAQFSPDMIKVGMVAGVFAVGQIIEGNYLTPKIVGEHVKLHPVWLLFALMSFGYLFGFVGLLVAVPVSAAIGVIVRFGAEQYKNTDIYIGKEGQLETSDTAPSKPTQDRSRA